MATSPPVRFGPPARRAPTRYQLRSPATTSELPSSSRSTSWSSRDEKVGPQLHSGLKSPSPGRRILDAQVWSTSEGPGLEHDETVPPDVPGPSDLSGPRLDPVQPYPFWDNLEPRIVHPEPAWPPDGPRPVWQEWLRFTPTATYADPWVDAARLLILVDLPSWPSAHRVHAWSRPSFIAPTLDLNVAFHRPASSDEWLLCDGSAPLSTRGLFGLTARIWSTEAKLLASGGGQCLYREVPSA